MAQPRPRQPKTQEDIERWRDWVYSQPGVIVHRPERQIPFVPTIRVTNVTDIRELLGRCDDDDDDVAAPDQASLERAYP